MKRKETETSKRKKVVDDKHRKRKRVKDIFSSSEESDNEKLSESESGMND